MTCLRIAFPFLPFLTLNLQHRHLNIKRVMPSNCRLHETTDVKENGLEENQVGVRNKISVYVLYISLNIFIFLQKINYLCHD